MTPSEKREGPKTLTKREFLRKVVVGGTVMFVAAGGYEKPELETLLGPQVAHATGSHHYGDHDWKNNEDYEKWKEWLEKLSDFFKNH